MGRSIFNIDQIKQQIDNADNDQFNDKYTESLQKNFDKVAELSKQLADLNSKVGELTPKVETATNAAFSAIYTIENRLQLVMSSETVERVKSVGGKICTDVISGIDTKGSSLLTEIGVKGEGIVTNIGSKGDSICQDIDSHAKSLNDDMEKAGNKIIKRMKTEEMRVCIPPYIFMSMLIAIILMVGMLILIACINQQSIHSSDINSIFGWSIASYVVFIVAMAWLYVRSRD